jgi:hypothetical protein
MLKVKYYYKSVGDIWNKNESLYIINPKDLIIQASKITKSIGSR